MQLPGTGKGMLSLKDDQPAPERIADWVYGKIRDAILEGELQPGARLSVPDLASGLGVSRSPVRESILRLLSEGLADEVPHSGAFVATITIDNLIDLYSVRKVLEGLAARLAAGNVSPEGRQRLEEALEAHGEAVDSGDRRAIVDADMAFHSLLYRMSGNPWLSDSLMRLQSLVRLGMQTTMQLPGSPSRALSEHEGILVAVIARDPDNAEASARAHIDRLRSALQTSRT
jgi:DNA-binding GntR family transcriptional regulator